MRNSIEQYANDELFGKAFAIFAGFAIFIACLGLFGLSLFSTTQRTKEIGVRKVLGASVSNIVLLLSKDFIKLVIVAFVIASPIAWFIMHNWLQILLIALISAHGYLLQQDCLLLQLH